MSFETPELQRYYELVTDRYHQAYNRYLDELDDDDDAFYAARQAGYEMITDYKTINETEEFATTYTTPGHVLDVWYELDEYSGKRIYERGFMRIRSIAG